MSLPAPDQLKSLIERINRGNQHTSLQGQTVMSEFEIEEGIPIPKKKQKTERRCKYPIYEMKIGDSFVAHIKAPNLSAYLRVLAFRNGLSMKFTVRTIEGGCRAWRVE